MYEVTLSSDGFASTHIPDTSLEIGQEKGALPSFYAVIENEYVPQPFILYYA